MHYDAYYGQVYFSSGYREDIPSVVPTLKKLENLNNEIHRIIE